MKMLPVLFRWIDGKMVPDPRYLKICGRQFADGEEYHLENVEHRSQASHNHFFASLGEAWHNLPETETRFPTVEHLRAWALVQAGYCTEKNFVCDSPAKARNLAAIVRTLNAFVVITIKGNVVRIFEPESQSVAAMKKDRFEESKAKVLEIVGELAQGVGARALQKEAAKNIHPAERDKPVAKQKAPPPDAQPTTAAEYRAYAERWIAKTKSRDDREARWDGEKEMRESLAVPTWDRTALIKLISER